MRRKRLIVLAVFLLVAGCAKKTAEPAALLPKSAAGWTRTAAPRSFAAADLWQYLDGGVEKYVHAGVVQTATADYSRGGLECVADVHRFASPGGARTLMDSEPGGEVVALGEAGRASGQALLFRRGPYLVRLVAYQQNAETRDALLELARAVDGQVKGTR